MISLLITPRPEYLLTPLDPGWLLKLNPKILPPNCPRPWWFIFTKCTVRDFGGRYHDDVPWERVTRHLQFGRLHLVTWIKRTDGDRFPEPEDRELRLTFYKPERP